MPNPLQQGLQGVCVAGPMSSHPAWFIVILQTTAHICSVSDRRCCQPKGLEVGRLRISRTFWTTKSEGFEVVHKMGTSTCPGVAHRGQSQSTATVKHGNAPVLDLEMLQATVHFTITVTEAIGSACNVLFRREISLYLCIVNDFAKYLSSTCGIEDDYLQYVDRHKVTWNLLVDCCK